MQLGEELRRRTKTLLSAGFVQTVAEDVATPELPDAYAGGDPATSSPLILRAAM
jgi:hypothetical protein